MTPIIPIPAFRDNYIWLLREGRYAAVVDPGDAAPVLAFLEANALELAAIIATHHHG
ncbi:MAG TPA: MBL fold metallo-hydrolase, partial [Casimicrobiaceae bacterium]|nr:MBL fold metallo-hydrolase [Casimicrobiaceae bacterium]